MLATENSLRKIISIFAAVVLAILPGCTPSGPRALLQGDELLREGKPAEAIKKLELAKAAMPDEPRVWNLLGLAYHRSGQPQLATQAYQHALAKDKSNVVAVAHYNLGCLLLEQNNPTSAAEHLRSYTLTTNSAHGLVKLATAQMRLRRLDLAEATLGSALRLEPKNSEALNGVGVIHALKSQRDAAQYFSAALQSNPKYAPAMLNAGLLAQQNPATRTVALQRFKEYIATASPSSSSVEAAKGLVHQIETEFAQQAAASNALFHAALKSNALNAALRATNQPSTSAPPRIVAPTNKPTNVVVVKTNPPAVKTNAMALQTNAPIVRSNPPLTVVAVTSAPTPKIAVSSPVIVQPATTAPPVTAMVPRPETVPIPREALPEVTEPEKKPGFFTRLNPFRSKAKPDSESSEVPRVVVLTPQTNAQVATAKPVFARYNYLSPPAPSPGMRREAERATAQAMKAERSGNTNEAWLNYHLAVSGDPSYFEAQYNAALLAYRLGDTKRALTGFETALAIKPDSIDTRYNFALALKQANHAHDAVNELQRILEAKPDEVRAHLALGNLYAQQLQEPAKARVHYAKVLELEPRNPQAAVIRFWLAANP